MTSPRFVFAVGAGRSGSSLVQEVLSRHPEVGFVSNIEDHVSWLRPLRRYNNQLYRLIPPELTTKGRLRYAPSEGYRALAREVSPLVATPGRPLESDDALPWLAWRFERFFATRAADQRHAVFLHKFTGWPRVGFIHRIWPQARFINVVRDGRAVASSLLQMPWWRDYQLASTLGLLLPEDLASWQEAGRSFPLLAGLVWKTVIDGHDRAHAEVGSCQWLDVRYEDLLDDPRAEFGRMLDFMGLGWDDRFERSFRQQAFVAGRRDAFQHELGPEAVALLEHHLGEHLERLGYALIRT